MKWQKWSIWKQKRIFCRAGSGTKTKFGSFIFSVFKLVDESECIYDQKGFRKSNLPKNCQRLLQYSLFLVWSNRATGNVSFLLYNTNPINPSDSDSKTLVGYVTDYDYKAIEPERFARDKTKELIFQESVTTNDRRGL